LVHAIPAIKALTPVLNEIRVYATASLPGTKLIGSLFSNLQRHGFSESFLANNYYLAASLARFDSTAHMVPVYLMVFNNGSCSNYATAPVAGCSAHYGAAPAYLPTTGPHASSASSGNRSAAGASAQTGASAHAPGERQRLRGLIGKLLQAGGAAANQQLQSLEQLLTGPGSAQPTTQNLLNYLLR